MIQKKPPWGSKNWGRETRKLRFPPYTKITTLRSKKKNASWVLTDWVKKELKEQGRRGGVSKEGGGKLYGHAAKKKARQAACREKSREESERGGRKRLQTRPWLR